MAGYPATITMVARQTVTFVGVVYIKVVGDPTVFPTPVTLLANADGSYAVSVTPSATIAAGRYTGNLTVNVCTDANCVNQLAGAPFEIPYDIQVVSADGGLTTYNLSALTPLPGVADWGTFQANASHTGHVPVTLTASAFNPRWQWTTPAKGGIQLTPSTLATGGGRVYLTTGQGWVMQSQYDLLAMNEADGSQAWRHSFADLSTPSTNPPAYAGGKVYVSAGSQESTAMFAFDAATGAQTFKSAMSSQWESYLAPTVFNGTVYSDGGTYGGMYAFDMAAGTQTFFTQLPQYDGWTPAVDDSHAYVYVGGALYTLDPHAGTMQSSIVDPNYSWNGYTTGGAPVLGAPDNVYAGNLSNSMANAIVDFAPARQTVHWQLLGAYAGNPAYADSTLFAANNSPFRLEAHAESDGSLAWSWTPPTGSTRFVSNVVVTDNLVFVSTDTTTYAIDRTLHTPAWSTPEPGQLAISGNGVLYIVGQHKVTAVNLH